MDEVIQGKGFTVRASKFDFFFGRVTSDPENIKRSLQNLKELNRLGIDETIGGRDRLLQIFAEGLNAPEVINYRKPTKHGLNITRKVEVIGTEATGAILVCYFYPSGNLDNIPQITSIIPMIYQE
ncbi:hypothetical protein PN499_02255 [Kamptonema animale CS-326]|jgi:hypothetical protein|uniref:hypothetical protein n=1 Tax=Kamptonema animale TaxID=92934 RepID=UPI0023310FB9|nr:hypothetical protein [Kamptonema animale]MDB9510030.1 hypothetical protein [Kamptonema animale CS-326]